MGRRRPGSVYRPKGRRNYYMECMIKGKRLKMALYNEAGEPITTREEAEARASLLLLPLMARTEADIRRAMLDALETAENAAERAEAAIMEAKAREEERKAKARTELKSCWRLYEMARAQGEPGKVRYGTNEYNYRGYFKRFAEWLRSRAGNGEEPRLADTTAEDALAFFRELERGSKPGTYNKYLQFLKRFAAAVFKAAGLQGQPNPFSEVPSIGNPRPNARKVLSAEKAGEILGRAQGEMKTLCFLGYYTGLRLGDCCTLEWGEIDLQRRIITRKPHKTRNSSGKVVKIGIPPRLMAQLETTPPERREGYVVPELARKYNLNRNNVSRPIRALFEACGLRNENGYTEYGFHSFRHTFITRHAEAGTPLAIIQGIVGHANPVMTEHYIGTISDEATRQYADRAYKDEPERPETPI